MSWRRFLYRKIRAKTDVKLLTNFISSIHFKLTNVDSSHDETRAYPINNFTSLASKLTRFIIPQPDLSVDATVELTAPRLVAVYTLWAVVAVVTSLVFAFVDDC